MRRLRHATKNGTQPMLDSYIIEEIKKEEERRRQRHERPRLRIDRPDGIPLRHPDEDPGDSEEEDKEPIVRIELR